MVRPSTSKSPLTPFLRDKLLVSIYNSCRHRSDALQDAGALTDTVIGKLSEVADEGVIYPDKLSELVHAILLSFDQVAATHYKAFHLK